MRGVREFGNALVIALISIGLMVGALSISLVEFVPESTPTATDVILPTPEPLTATPTFPPTPTSTIGLESPTATATETFVNTATPPPLCPPPTGWTNQITIQAGDTIQVLAERYRVTTDAIRSANCLPSDTLFVGTKLYVPPAATSTVAVCVPGSINWSRSYIVKAGNTIYSIATNYFTTADTLKRVNCKNSDYIYPGELLWVPFVPATRTPFPTAITVIPSFAPSTPTSLPYTLTAPPTFTPVPPSPTTAPTATDVPFTFTPSPTAIVP